MIYSLFSTRKKNKKLLKIQRTTGENKIVEREGRKINPIFIKLMSISLSLLPLPTTSLRLAQSRAIYFLQKKEKQNLFTSSWVFHSQPLATSSLRLARSRLISFLQSPCHVFSECSRQDPSCKIALCNAFRFTKGTVVGLPWAHCIRKSSITSPGFVCRTILRVPPMVIKLTWKHNDVRFSSSTMREHSEGRSLSPNIIAPWV